MRVVREAQARAFSRAIYHGVPGAERTKETRSGKDTTRQHRTRLSSNVESQASRNNTQKPIRTEPTTLKQVAFAKSGETATRRTSCTAIVSGDSLPTRCAQRKKVVFELKWNKSFGTERRKARTAYPNIYKGTCENFGPCPPHH